MYCSIYIQVPADLPQILKEFTKEVIRAGVSGDELLAWSANYFQQKAAEQNAAQPSTEA